jgi:hypothetical protein
MANGNGGYVRIYRSILENPAFRNAEEAMFFAFLVVKANWKAGERRYDERVYRLRRGQLVLGERKLVEAFPSWSRNKLRGLMCRLEAAGMLARKWDQHGDQRAPVITICHYSIYQVPAKEGDQRRDQDGTKVGPPKNKGKEGKEDSAPNGAGTSPAPASVDPGSIIFGRHPGGCLHYLLTNNVKEKSARGLLGRWRKDHGDGATIEVVAEAGRHAVSEPVAWIEATLRARERRASGARPFDDGRH